MQALDDIALLRQFAASRSEAAFEQLVSRHAGLVHSAALRQVRDPQLAAEITQAVFLILAQKAARLSDKTILTGWLFKTTRFVALAQVRAEVKRRQREQETQMHTQLQTGPSSAAGDQVWAEVAPLLDQALEQLGKTDREAVLLRFFENKSLAEVGKELGAGEDTARKRVSRALEKLRRFFAKRGVFYTSAVIAAAISANAVQTAPVGVVAAIPAMAVKGSAVVVSTLALVKEALQLMTIAKLKTAALVTAVAVLVSSGAIVVSRSVAQGNQLPPEMAQAVVPAAGNQSPANTAGQSNNSSSLSEDEVHEMARLRNEVGLLLAKERQLRQLSNFLANAQATTNQPGVTDTVWFINSSNELMALPPAFTMRPTHFRSVGGGGGGPGIGDSGGEIGEGTFMFAKWAPSNGGNGNMPILARNVSLDQLMAKAFGVDLDRVVMPDNAPQGHFDLLMTGPNATKATLQAELKSRLGYTAHLESSPTDVLLLTSGSNAIELLHPVSTNSASGGGSAGGSGGRGGGGSIGMNYPNISMAMLTRRLQSFFDEPIIDRTGLTGNYDISISTNWEAGTTRQEALMGALASQDGLVLLPRTESFDQLIVENDQTSAPPAESQAVSNGGTPGDVQKSFSKPTVQNLNRLRGEKATLVADIAQLTKATDEMNIAQSSANAIVIDEHVWSITGTAALSMLPPTFILRPTQFTGRQVTSLGIKGRSALPPNFTGGKTASEDKPMQVLGRNITFAELIATAFDIDNYKLFLPPDGPTNGFDLLMTGPDATRKRLQAEIKSQLGYVAHLESRPSNVLLLKVAPSGTHGLEPKGSTTGQRPIPSHVAFAGGSAEFANMPISSLLGILQSSFDLPIIDRSGLSGKFDFKFTNATKEAEVIKKNLTEQLGLELTPGTESIELLVVEADKGN